MTFLSEVEYYWIPAKPSLSFFLFVINRYIGILGPIPVFFEYFAEVSEHVSVSDYTYAPNVKSTDTLRSGALAYRRHCVGLLRHEGILTWTPCADVESCNYITKYLQC